MLRLQTKIAALKSLKCSSSGSPYQYFPKRVQRSSSASNKTNFQKLSSLFPPQSTSPRSNRKTPLAKPSKNNSKPSPLKSDAKCCSSVSIQSDSQPPDSSFIHSLNALVKNKNYPEAVYCYKRFVSSSSGSPSNFIILNMLLNSYCNLKLASSCGFSVFGIILKTGFSPNTITFTSLMKGLCLEERIGEASKLFRKMIQLGFYPNVITCTALISGLCNAGNTKAALKLHTQMLNGEVGLGRSCKPTLVSYGSLIDGVCKAGLLVKAKELLLEMKSREISPNVVVYTSLLSGFCFSGRWEEARLLYREMMNDGVQANVMTLHAVLSSLCKQGKANKVTELIARGGDLTDLIHTILMDVGGN